MTAPAKPAAVGALSFPIHSQDKRPGPRSVPWSFIAPHEQRALRNHNQSLARLAERGGLSFCELAAVVEGRRYRPMTDAEVAAFVATLPSLAQTARREP